MQNVYNQKINSMQSEIRAGSKQSIPFENNSLPSTNCEAWPEVERDPFVFVDFGIVESATADILGANPAARNLHEVAKIDINDV